MKPERFVRLEIAALAFLALAIWGARQLPWGELL